MYFRFHFLFIIFSIMFLVLPANAQNVQTGSFEIASSSEAILGKESALEFESLLDIDEEIKWKVYVPEAYDPDKPPGILLYQLYGSEIDDPSGWKTAMDEQNMMLIRIIGKGGTYPHRKELLINILAPLALQQKYKIDTTRIYTSSYADCDNAGALAQFYPNVIKGAIYINCNPSIWRGKEPEQVRLMRKNRYYFIAGRDRSGQINNQREIKKYRDAGIENVKFVRTGRLKRRGNLNRPMLIEAIDYLDGKETAEN